MELHEKLQQLRKQRGLTQEELARQLYVSRTAISKWESGRGIPSIDSLKAISKFFSLSLDDLLSGEELLAIAENDRKETARSLRDPVFGLLDCGMALLLFLPFFGQSVNGTVEAVSLLAFTEIQPYLKAVYLAITALMPVLGIVTLALQGCRHRYWLKSKHTLSLTLSAVGLLVFIVSQQPYAAVFTLGCGIIKAFLLVKRQ